MYKFAINRPIATLMLFITLLFCGTYSIFKMPINLFPNIEIPVIKILTKVPGDLNYVESKITKKIEDEISIIDGIKKITSVSYNNLSVVLVEFQLSKNIEVAANDIRDKLTKLTLPSTPEIEKISADGGKIFSIFLSSKDINALMGKIDSDIKPFLSRIPGIGKVEDVGFLEPEVRIMLDPLKLAKYNISSSYVYQVLKTQNIQQPLGKIKNKDNEFIIASDFESKNIDDLKQIRIMPGVFLENIASIYQGVKDSENLAIYNNNLGICLDILKVNGANTLETIKNLKSKLPELNSIVGADNNLEIVYDKSQTIKKHLSQVAFDMIFGIFLTTVIVFLFLRNLTITIIAAITIPTSIISTFFIIDVLGYDLNRLTLMALTIGIGIFIDDAIVVVENISKKLVAFDKVRASFEGVKEISFSILSISAVLLCVFIPISFMDGIVGRYFESFAMSVSGGIVISFFASIMLIPMLCSIFFKSSHSNFFDKTEKFFTAIEEAYEKILVKILNLKLFFIGLVLIILSFSFVCIGYIGTDFMPMEDDSEFEIYVEDNNNISLALMQDKVREISQILDSDKDVLYHYSLIGYNDAKEASKAKIYVKLEPIQNRDLRQSEIIKKYRQKLSSVKSKILISRLPLVDSVGITQPIQIAITGKNFTDLEQLSKKTKEILHSIDGVVDIKSSIDDKRDEIKITIKKEKAKLLNLTAKDIAQALYLSFESNIVGSMDYDDKNYDISMRFDDGFRTMHDLKNFKIINQNGDSILLETVCDINIVKNISVINRLNKQREVLITANAQNVALGDIKNIIDKNLSDIKQGYSHTFLGDIELMQDTNRAFLLTVLFSAILIYFILASLYESFILPLIVMLTMPLAFCGVVFGLILSGNNFSLFVMTGSILLFGMVGKNAILVVDFANRLAKENDLQRAIIGAGKKRLRAILMTTFAMVFAMLPLVFSKGNGYEANSAMAIAIISGLISSTILTLLLIPALFEGAYKLDSRLRKIYEKEQI